jgi:hypothetical protein
MFAYPLLLRKMISMKKGVFALVITMCLSNFTYAAIALNTAASASAAIALIVSNSVKHAHIKSKGFAVTQTQDTIKGYFTIFDLTPKQRIYYYATINKDLKSRDSFLTMGTIKSIYLEPNSKSLPKFSGMIHYKYLPAYKKMYREIKCGKYIFYDENYCTIHPNLFFGEVLVTEGNKIFDLDPLTKLFNKNMFKSNFKLLVDFYNLKFNSKVPYSSFKNTWDVFEKMRQ